MGEGAAEDSTELVSDVLSGSAEGDDVSDGEKKKLVLDTFKMPTEDFKNIFTDFSVIANWFRPRIRATETTYPMSFTNNVVDFEVLKDIIHDAPKEAKFLHIGYIQIGIVPLFSSCKDICAAVAIVDNRFTDKKNAISGMVGCRLDNGPAIIKHCPGFALSLTDKHIKKAILLKVKLVGLGHFRKGAEFLSIVTKLYVRYSMSAIPKVKFKDEDVYMPIEMLNESDGEINFERRVVDVSMMKDPSFWDMSTSTNGKVVTREDVESIGEGVGRRLISDGSGVHSGGYHGGSNVIY